MGPVPELEHWAGQVAAEYDAVYRTERDQIGEPDWQPATPRTAETPRDQPACCDSWAFDAARRTSPPSTKSAWMESATCRMAARDRPCTARSPPSNSSSLVHRPPEREARNTASQPISVVAHHGRKAAWSSPQALFRVSGPLWLYGPAGGGQLVTTRPAAGHLGVISNWPVGGQFLAPRLVTGGSTHRGQRPSRPQPQT